MKPTCESTRHSFLKLDEWRIYCRRCGEFRQWVYSPTATSPGGTWTAPNITISDNTKVTY